MTSMSKLPDNWAVKPLGEVCKIIKGKKPKDSGSASNERTVPYINIKAFESGQPVEFAAPGGYPACERDDVLIVWDGARAGLTGRGVSGYIGSTLAKIYSDAADNRYLFYFLRSQYDQINSRTKGVGIPHVDPSIFNKIPFPIAPLDQQERIVSEIEKQFSRLDEAVANLKRVKANLKRYKTAVLKAAVEGKLTEEWRKEHLDVEPASELLKRILTERRKKWEEAELAKMKAKGKEPKDDEWKKKYKQPSDLDSTNLPDLPQNWIWGTIDQLAAPGPNSITDGPFGSNLKTAHYRSSGPRVIRLQNISEGKFLDEEAHISEEHYKKLLKHEVLPGDVIIAALGHPAPRACLIPLTLGKAIVKADCIKFRPSAPKVLPAYLMYAINSQPTQKRTYAIVHGVGRPRLNLGEIKGIALPVPPTDEQKSVLQEIESRLSVVEGIVNELDHNIERAERLRQSILARAFSGALIQQELGLNEEHTSKEMTNG